MSQSDKKNGSLDNSKTSNNSDIKKRLSDLDVKLSKAKGKETPEQLSERRSAYSYAFRISSELIAGPVVGGFIGYWIDRYLESTPIFLLILLFLGFAAGMMNVIRTAQEMQRLNNTVTETESHEHADRTRK